MARKTDNRAARERKQKIFVAIGGVVVLALFALQGPKVLKQLQGSSTAAPAAATAAGGTQAAGRTGGTSASTSTATSAPVAPAVPVNAPKSATAQLAGVVIVPEQPVRAGKGQLQSLSRFDTKDPFVQQVGEDKLPTPAEVGGLTPVNASTTAPKPVAGSTPGATTPENLGPTVPGATAPAVALTTAMLRVNGVLHTLEVKQRFPRFDKAFVLRSLKPGRAVVAVVGGSFAGNATLTLRLGRQVTLVNTATGVRYVVKLVYVGGDRTQVAAFTAK